MEGSAVSGQRLQPELAGLSRAGDEEARRQPCADGHAHQARSTNRMTKRLGIGFVGGGFITRFHVQSFVGVRDADILGVWSPRRESAERVATLARDLDVGACRAYGSITEMVADPNIQALWICGPNHARIENIEEIVAAI